MNDALRPILRELDAALRRLHGSRYHGLVLFGSQARGDAEEGSDVDLLVLLDGPVHPVAEIDRIMDVVARLSLENDLVLAVIPVDFDAWPTSDEPLLRSARREGVRVP
jgi:predicted nucleotidyltransferase